MWRCVNDIFSYCAQEPVWAVEPSQILLKTKTGDVETGSLCAGLCQNSPNSCEHRLNASDIIKPMPSKPKGSRTRKK